MTRKYVKSDPNPSKMFIRWTEETAYCYKRHCICEGCILAYGCSVGDKYDNEHKNPYGLRRLKYAVLMTIQNVGFEGLERYNFPNRNERNNYD